MEFGEREHISHPAGLVYETARDRMVELVPFLPAVESIEVVARHDEPDMIHIDNVWQGSTTDVPKAVRAFIKPEHLRWKDSADWLADDLTCLWSLETFVGNAFYECNGRTYVEPDGDNACWFGIEATLQVHPERVPGIPRLLAGRLAGSIERFVANLLKPNLTSVAKGVQDYLDAQQSS